MDYDADARPAPQAGGRGRPRDARRHARPQVPAASRARRRRALSRRVDAVPGRRAAERCFSPTPTSRSRRHDPCVRRAVASPRHRGGLDVGDSVLRPPDLSAARHPDEGRSDDDGALDRGAAAAARSPARRVRRDGFRPACGCATAPRNTCSSGRCAASCRTTSSIGRKQGFAVPLARWFRGELVGVRARPPAVGAPAANAGCSTARYIERLLQLHERGRDIDLQLWTLLSFELWCRRVLDAPIQTVDTPARATGQRILPAVFAAAS